MIQDLYIIIYFTLYSFILLTNIVHEAVDMGLQLLYYNHFCNNIIMIKIPVFKPSVLFYCSIDPHTGDANNIPVDVPSTQQ